MSRPNKYGLRDDEYEALLEAQGGCCAICLMPVDRLLIDHAHDCCAGASTTIPACGLCVRGLLCSRCNNLLGYLEGTPDGTLKRAFDYLAGKNPRGYLGRRLDPPRLKLMAAV